MGKNKLFSKKFINKILSELAYAEIDRWLKRSRYWSKAKKAEANRLAGSFAPDSIFLKVPVDFS